MNPIQPPHDGNGRAHEGAGPGGIDPTVALAMLAGGCLTTLPRLWPLAFATRR